MTKDSLIYISSADNYVNIWYMNKMKLSNFMLRNTLKNVEESLNIPTITRCHRSYVVNFDHVKIVKRTKEGVFLEFDNPEVPNIPMSKTYSKNVTNIFLHQ